MGRIPATVEEMREAGRRNGLEREHPITRELYNMSKARCASPPLYDDPTDREKYLAYCLAFEQAISIG